MLELCCYSVKNVVGNTQIENNVRNIDMLKNPMEYYNVHEFFGMMLMITVIDFTI